MVQHYDVSVLVNRGIISVYVHEMTKNHFCENVDRRQQRKETTNRNA